MNISDMMDVIDETRQKIIDLTKSKGREYAQDNSDRLHNFKAAGLDLKMLPEQVLLVYLHKHMASIKTHIADLAVGRPISPSEPIEGRIDDAILYLVLLKCLLRDLHAARG